MTTLGSRLTLLKEAGAQTIERSGREPYVGIRPSVMPQLAPGYTLQSLSRPRTTACRMDSRSVLDACCGSRMFWFDRSDNRAVFIDKRKERHMLKDSSSRGGSRELIIDPDFQADFTALPFSDGRFALVVFDPPHLVRNGSKGWLAKKYGKLEGDWREELRKGFAECFRVLKVDGTLIFKWNDNDVPVSQILALTPERPLFGNRCGKSAKSHWIVFQKPPAHSASAIAGSSPEPASGEDYSGERDPKGDAQTTPITKLKQG